MERHSKLGDAMRGYNAYQQTTRQTATPRGLEYRLLGEVTAAMLAAEREPADRHAKTRALLWNKKVWDNFMLELSEDNNALPRQLRAALVSLGIWVTRETYRVMDELDSATSLIDINKEIMQGLA